jgi:CBS domain-containing membrane protein
VSEDSKTAGWLRWRPILPGANLPDRLSAALAATVGVALTGVISALATRQGPLRPDIVAPLGASAVLVFAVPASPLAQPWSAFGGNVISGLVALTVSRVIGEPALAIGVAVGAAIAAMSLFRCLHPPGGAVALLTSLAAAQGRPPSYLYALNPIALNTALLVASAWAYHKYVSGHAWPHRPLGPSQHGTSDPAPAFRYALRDEDIDAAAADMREAFDIAREDLAHLLRQVELRAFTRAHGALRCADIMSKDVITVDPTETMRTAAERLRKHRLAVLPVVNKGRLVVGALEAPELGFSCEFPEALVAAVMRPPLTAAADSPAFALLGPLSQGRAHGAVVVDPDGRLVGLLTQTDLIAAVAHEALFNAETFHAPA